MSQSQIDYIHHQLLSIQMLDVFHQAHLLLPPFEYLLLLTTASVTILKCFY